MSQTTQQMVNGVDVQALLETVKAMQQTPSLGTSQFRARNRWLGGGHNRTMIKDFYIAGQEDTSRQQPFIMDCDEPPVLLGRNQGANPVEHALNALAGCLTSAMAYHAAARGIHIESIESELEGDMDLRGFLGITNQVPRGYQRIRVTFHVKSDAPADQLQLLAQYSPVFNTIINPTPVEVRVMTDG